MRIGLRVSSDQAAAVERLRAAERFAVDGSSAEDMARGCVLFDVVDEGAAVGAIAVDLAGERRAVVTAAASRGAATWQHLVMLEQTLRINGVRRVALFTRRRGLVRQLARRGYQPVRPVGADGVAELEKEL
ncbi:hypothetical protein [Piscinibacter sp.]|uniref:hypothetical protein n=1 Tax=Piscinibacter sp. TaxID=1903157 RepID=UPI0039E2D41C